MSIDQDRISTGRVGAHHASDSLIDRIADGEAYAVAFGGQGAPWLPTLAELVVDAELGRHLEQTVGAAARLTEPVAAELAIAAPDGFDPLRWVELFDSADALGDGTGFLPDDGALMAAATSIPGILLAQLAALASLRKQGLDTDLYPPTSAVGHSQGCLAVDAVRIGENVADLPGEGAMLALARLIGAAASITAARRGLNAAADGSPMLSITNVQPARIEEILAQYRAECTTGEQGLPVIALRNGRRGVVIAGAPAHLAAITARCEQIAEAEAADRKRKLTGGSPFAPTFDALAVSVAFHHPEMADAVDLVEDWAQRCGLDPAWARRQAQALLVDPVDWTSIIAEVHADGAKWILDLGPSDAVTRLTSSLIRGTGIGLIPAALRGGQRNLFAPGGIPEVAHPWNRYAPRLAVLPDGRAVIDTAFTRLTGRSPMLLAGMTPTTVDPAIVAAAANAGHWAELAGGGQVTEEIFADNVERLTELLEPGRQAQFNALYLDPYLWKLQLGGKRIVQKARAQGAPIDGVIVSAGIPELDDAVALVDELVEAGLHYVAFKPGTVAQIRDVVRIAAEVPHHPVIVQIEGGRAGGHHSWEDLDDLLLATYAELRDRANVVICVGGGIGTPERAADYLSGRWALAHDHPLMPLDGILVGTAAMATAEATTSPEVKQLLVATAGCDEWIGAGHSDAGMASGRSQLGADIHEVDNSASRCGRLLDEVAGDGDAVAARRDEIIEALAATAKPYFGDVASMTYEQWLRRYATLAVGEPGAELEWADITWRRRFVDLLQRAEARLHAVDRGTIETLFADVDDAGAHASVDRLVAAYPAATVDVLHPADVAFFLDLCKSPGKPVNFVPVVDADVRRWWRSDSLWQAHDPRYGADEVCVIPGPVAVGGITEVDEPVGALLDRFEAALVAELSAAGEPAVEVDARRRTLAGAAGPIAAVLSAADARWADRIVPNPVARLGHPERWDIVTADLAEHEPSGASLRRRSGADGFDLVVPIGSSTTTIPLTVAPSIVDGGAPLVGIDDAGAAMTQIVEVAAGGSLAETTRSRSGDLTARADIEWNPDLAADHRGVTSASLPSTLAPEPGLTVPDALVGLTWPSVFALIGAARTADGTPVVEGLLDLVHLDHAIAAAAPLPTERAQLTATAVLTGVTDTAVGRVLAVDVEIAADDRILARLTERFAIRGRLGAAELDDPVRAGGLADDERDANRKFVRAATITAPRDMNGFALVSGDHNPIHTDANAAALAGLGEPIVHGMWLSAAAQQVLTARDTRRGEAPRAIEGWTVRFLGMVRLGDAVDIRVDRVGLDRGREVVEVTMKVDGELVAAATARLAAPLTVYAFPGQGIQSKGMGLDARARSAAAREIWDRADAHTREALGFSILAVVRDNPTTLVANGTTYHHPDGVLFLTQFTQVAMATLGVAQVAELREAGGFVENAITAGHSVGEYNALAACAGVLPLEAVLEVVFQRGEAMHHLVPRDAKGNSDYRMAAIRPSQFDLADDDVDAFVAGVGEECGEFLEVVNLNLRGSQYAIAGTVAGLKALESEIERRVAAVGGKRAFILVPGIDVPFHSTVLREGVPAFRERLDDLLPEHVDPEILVGRYIPNLVPRLFNLRREFIAEIAELVPSEPLEEVLADFDSWAARPAALARVVLIELLAWQFASPVRWIETQDLLFGPTGQGGLNVGRFVEIGVKSAPTLSGIAANTLKLDRFAAADAEVLNVERDTAVLLAQDEGAEPEPEVDEAPADSGATPAPQAEPAAQAPAPA
ncbi:fatty acid synthase subunit beta domain-containing protein, partial [Gordonia sp. (in: high G+C Gram-positive bacteria)]|uniref:fatty acid synthase subunit beta domain-containing protein n=1 Tax=Gordonia sp. (in: high G+C Gram-positive bacteria) TaxID=84139 RepID=UPI0039E32556